MGPLALWPSGNMLYLIFFLFYIQNTLGKHFSTVEDQDTVKGHLLTMSCHQEPLQKHYEEKV